MDGAGLQQLAADDFIEQPLGVGEEFARFFAVLFVLENRRVATTQFPGVEERSPVDEGN